MHIETLKYVDSSHTEVTIIAFYFFLIFSLVYLTFLFVYSNVKNINVLKWSIIFCFLSMFRKWTVCFQNFFQSGKIDTSVG